MAITQHGGRWTLEDRFASVWQYLPVEVPAGSCALRAELEYDRSGAVLDLGCIGPAGFRGWSGGARRSFVISPDSATPGYLPAELEPGTWQVMLGLHRVPPGGAEYRVIVEVASTPGRLRPGPAPDLLPPLAERPARRELPAVAATHGIALLPGQEVTTEEGHAGALGNLDWIDFREPADCWLDATERGGGLLSVNHPIGGHVSWTIPMKRRPPLIELWHWSWLDTHWTTPLGWWMAWDPGAIPVGGSDWHRPGSDAPPGSPTTWVECEQDDPRQPADPELVLDAIRAGRTAISASRDGPVLLRVDGDLLAAGADGTILAGPDGPKARVRGPLARFPGTAGCHRLIDPTGAVLALTS